jgi:hypothetical protein
MKKSVKSVNPWQSVILTSYDFVKAQGGEISLNTQKAEARPPARPGHYRQTNDAGLAGKDDPVGRGTEFIIQIPVN